MELTVLGAGTSQGVPMIAHHSAGLDLANPRNWRTRSSVHVVMAGLHIQVDAAPEFRLQCLANDIRRVDLVILTHGHADHLMGMDDMRRFIDLRGGAALPVYSTEEGLGRLREAFPYAMRDQPEFQGYPAFKPFLMPPVLELPGGRIESCRLPHGRVDVLGLVFHEDATRTRLAYFTDCKQVTAEAMARAAGADVLVLDALRPEPHPTHLSIPEAIETAHALKAKRTLFTHMTYHVDEARDGANLPVGMSFAYDGLRVTL